MDSVTLKFIQDNVVTASVEQIQDAFQRNNKDTLATISELMHIPVKEQNEKTEWEKRREIFDSYDNEMQKMLNLSRQQNTQTPSPENPTPTKKQKIT